MSDTFAVGNLIVRVEQDSDVPNPRKEWDHAATMVCWHRRYELGEKHSYTSPSDFRRFVNEKKAVILPLYLYDHSGITMRTTPFSCPWDSGQVGFIFMTFAQIRNNWGVKRMSKKLREKAIALMQSEVAEYDQYLTGDVYGVVVEDQEGNHLDSCYGFYGYEYAKEEGKRMAESCLESQAKVDNMEANQYAL